MSLWQNLAAKVASRDDFLRACAAWAKAQVLGDGKEPRSAGECEAVQEKLASLQPYCGVLSWKPLPKQQLYLDAPVGMKMFLGGNQIGKTSTVLVEQIAWCLGFRPWSLEPVTNPWTKKPVKPPIRTMIGGKSFVSTHAEVTLPKLRELIPFPVFVAKEERMQGGIVHKIHFRNGSAIRLMSYDADPQAWEGATYHKADFDECVSEHLVVATRRGCMKWQAPIGFSQTPLSEPWLFDKYYDHPDTYHVPGGLLTPEEYERHRAAILALPPKAVVAVEMHADENTHLTVEAREDYFRSMDEEMLEARRYGRYTHLIGRVYKTYDEGVHLLDDDYAWKPEWPAGCVVDPHPRKPWAIGWFVVNPLGQRIWVAEWPPFDFVEVRSFESEAGDYVERIVNMERELGLSNLAWRIMDPNFGRTPNAVTGKTLQEELGDRGIWFECDVDDDIDSGHMFVRTALKERTLFFLRRCANFRKSMSHYTWDDWQDRKSSKGPKEKARERYKDFADLVRYMVKSEPGWFEGQVQRTKTRMGGWL